MARNRSSHPAPERALSTYRRDPATKAAHVVAVAVPLAAAVITMSIVGPILLMLLAEAFVLTVLPRLRAFQTYVDERRARERKLAAALQRAALLARMSPARCAELQKCEALVADIRGRSGCASEHDEWAGLDALLALYVRLSIAFDENTTVLDPASTAQLDGEIARLEAARDASHGALHEALDSRLAILRRRRHARTKAIESRAVIACTLETIVDLVHCLHDECTAVQGASACRDANEALPRTAENIALLGELAALREDDAFDPSILELGRRAAMEPIAPDHHMHPVLVNGTA